MLSACLGLVSNDDLNRGTCTHSHHMNHFFLKKLKRFSLSFSFPSLLRSVTAPSVALFGDTGGIVIALVKPFGAPGEWSEASPGEEGSEALIKRIQLLISAWKEKKPKKQKLHFKMVSILDVMRILQF